MTAPWTAYPDRDSYALARAEIALAEPPPDPGPDWRPEWGADPRLDPAYQPDRPEDIARRAALIARELAIDDELAEVRGRLVALPNIGRRTALDLPFGPPADQLADPYVTADGVTIVYGRGGVGKGVLCAWLISRLVQAGHVVMILDFEYHRREWGSRLRGLGLSDDELRQVHWRSPSSDDWTAPKGTLGQVYGLVRDDCDRLSVTVVVVDSYTTATSGDDSLGGQMAAQEFFSGLSRIGRPAVAIAHVRGDSERFPARPFGSVFVHNLARETWAVEAVSTPDAEPDPMQPNVVALELRNQKANGRPKAPDQALSFSFYVDGTIECTTAEAGNRTAADTIANVLRAEDLTLDGIRKAIREDTGQTLSEDTIRSALKRHPDRFAERDGKRPHKWGIR